MSRLPLPRIVRASRSYEHYLSLKATTPAPQREIGVRRLFDTSREYLCRAKRDSLESVLRSELNALNPERLSVTFALIHYILETKRDRWEKFLHALEQESYDNGNLKGPEGRWLALVQATKLGLGLGIEDLDKELQDFVTKRYLYTEEIARLIGVDRDCAEAAFQGFVKTCELKRQNKPVSEKSEKIYQDILERIDKKLQAQSEKF